MSERERSERAWITSTNSFIRCRRVDYPTSTMIVNLLTILNCATTLFSLATTLFDFCCMPYFFTMLLSHNLSVVSPCNLSLRSVLVSGLLREQANTTWWQLSPLLCTLFISFTHPFVCFLKLAGCFEALYGFQSFWKLTITGRGVWLVLLLPGIVTTASNSTSSPMLYLILLHSFTRGACFEWRRIRIRRNRRATAKKRDGLRLKKEEEKGSREVLEEKWVHREELIGRYLPRKQGFWY